MCRAFGVYFLAHPVHFSSVRDDASSDDEVAELSSRWKRFFLQRLLRLLQAVAATTSATVSATTVPCILGVIRQSRGGGGELQSMRVTNVADRLVTEEHWTARRRHQAAASSSCLINRDYNQCCRRRRISRATSRSIYTSVFLSFSVLKERSQVK